MKKVMIAINTLYGGGAERVASIWSSELSQLGYNVSLLLYGRTENEYHVDKNVHIFTVATSYEEVKKIGYLNRLSIIRKIIKRVHPDVIINFLPKMQIYVMLSSFGIKMYRVETVRVSPWEVSKNNFWGRKFWIHCFKKADAVIIQTPEQADYFKKNIKTRCITIPNPISNVCVKNFKEKYEDKANKFIASGRLTEQKNYPMMFKAFAAAHRKYPGITLSVFGTGDDDYVKKLEAFIDEICASDYITLMGRTNEMVKELLDHDVYLMTSDYEGMPNALAEAMACGLVCISTDCRTGPKDLIDNGVNGFLVEVNNTQQMEEAIERTMLFDKEQLTKIGNAARSKILDFCNEANSRDRLIDLIEHGIKES